MKAGLNLVDNGFVILMFRRKSMQQTMGRIGTKKSRHNDGHTLDNVEEFPCPLPGEIFQSPRLETDMILVKTVIKR
jgi:hypothetical protein